jgi:hypothetical protein
MKIISGGQTGVDRGALDAALDLGLSRGGWCPRGRRAEDGPIDSRYPLWECDTDDYAVRTEQNVLDSDATLILCRGPLQGGTRLTARLARRHGKPLLVLNQFEPDAAGLLAQWLLAECPRVLNVAGPRESNEPGIQDDTRRFLVEVLGREGRSEDGQSSECQ